MMYGYRPFKDRPESKKLDFTTLPEAKKATKDKKATKRTSDTKKGHIKGVK